MSISADEMCVSLPDQDGNGLVDAGADSCQGDSGGPLVCPTNDKVTVTGIVSWGIGCAGEGYPGVYGEVFNYITWIQNHIDNPPLGDFEEITSSSPSGNYCSNRTTGSRKKRSRKIIGGSASAAGSWPFIVRVVSQDAENAVSFCSGTVVDRNFVLTSGTCCDGQSSADLIFGDLDTSVTDEGNQFTINVANMAQNSHTHTGFSDGTSNMCLVRIEEDIIDTGDANRCGAGCVEVACLPDDGNSTGANSSGSGANAGTDSSADAGADASADAGADAGSSTSGFTADQDAGLAAHNEKRGLHGSPDMALNADLNAKVQKGADYIALIETMAHAIGSHRSASTCLDDLGHGENIYWAKGFTPTYTQATTAWYDEINFYDFNNPGNQLAGSEDKAIGHLTQVVWKTSVNLGMGHAVAANGGTYIVARYTARGNYIGQYGDNVPELLAGRSSAVNRGVAVHGAACWTAGWGATTPDGTASTTLQEVGVNIMDDQWCTDNPDASFVFNASNEMCVGLPDGDVDAGTLTDSTTVGPCNDLGAPLLCAVDCNVVLTGVANVNVCADVETAGFPSKYGLMRPRFEHQ